MRSSKASSDGARFERVPVADLVPYARNARTHSPEQVAQIAASIREFGFISPVIVDAENSIIAGHGRVLAAQKLKLSQVPCVRVEHLSETQKRAYILADNKLALNAGWDDELLRVEIATLKDEDFDALLTGFSEEELQSLLAADQKEAEPEGDLDDCPEVETKKPAVTVRGMTWLLGKHRLRCGDSTSTEDVAALMAGDMVDITFTSPPYNAGKPFTNRNSGNLKQSFYLSHEDNMTSEGYKRLLQESLSNALLSSRYALVNLQFLNGNKRDIIDWLSNNKNKIVDVLCAVKTNAVPAFHQGQLNCGFEMIFAFGNSSETRSFEGACFSKGTQSNVFTYPKDTEKGLTGVHDARFPVAFAEQFVECFAKTSVLDLFGGSGSTLIACEKTKRQCFMMELDEHYCDVIVRRWQQFTGKQATLEGDGRTFDEIAGIVEEAAF